MKIAFRADASIQIGTGHVMRCLTLAGELKRQGHECLFICRDHEGHLGRQIENKGFALHLLSVVDESKPDLALLDWNDHAVWLGVTWHQDAKQTRDVLNQQKPVDWLVVDHYALDSRWERMVAEQANRIMVIDDLADRLHQCDLLLDQTFGRKKEDYRKCVSANCELLCGSQYALLRPEFAELRPYSLQRRAKPELRQLLITMGGVDKDNATGQVLDALRESELTDDCCIVVVMGATALWLDTIKQQAETMPWPTEVKVGVNNMAQLMADSDLAIGAAGSTSWERCCLGLPTIMVVLAVNQENIAANLATSGAAVTLYAESLATDLVQIISNMDNTTLKTMSNKAELVCDGQGVQRILERLALE